MKHMNTIELYKLARDTHTRWPYAELVKNQVGNLNVHDGGQRVAWLDLHTGEINEDYAEEGAEP